MRLTQSAKISWAENDMRKRKETKLRKQDLVHRGKTK